jgi:hypothetical protein
MEDAALHPILDHLVAALELDRAPPGYDPEDLLALDDALAAIGPDDEAVAVFAGMAEWLTRLHAEGLVEARDAVLGHVQAWLARRPGLAPDPTGHDATDGREEAPAWTSFAGAPRAPAEPPPGPGFGLLNLRVSEASARRPSARRRGRPSA